MKTVLARDIALEVLNHLDNDPVFSEQHFEFVLKKNPSLSKRDRAFIYNIVQGVLRWRIRFDWILRQFVCFSFRKIEPPVLNILRISLYQIFHMDRVPQSAAVNEAVKQAKVVGKGHASGFVNGILRQICRRKTPFVFPDKRKDIVQYLSVFYSYPTWLVKKWINELGVDSAERLLEAGNRIPDLVIRTNCLKTDRTALIRLLENEGMAATPTSCSPDGIKVDGLKGRVSQLKTFESGLFQVQGEAAQICTYLLNPLSGESILDLCAGLGGKSTHLSELMGGKGRVFSVDISRKRLTKFLESSKRLGIECAQPVVADACRNLSSLFNCAFDKILIDGPCSGLGTISKHPDGKWSRVEKDIKRLSHLQSRLLNEVVPLVKKGGTILYVTCTISEEENEGLVAKFLEKNRGMALENLTKHAPEWAFDLIDDQGFFKTFPHVHEMDGFFAALFRAKEK